MTSSTTFMARRTFAAWATMTLALLCISIGYFTSHSPVAGVVLSAAIVVPIVFVFIGAERFTTVMVALLPWLVVLIDVTPRLTLTFVTAITVVLLLIRTPLAPHLVSLPWVAAFIFITMILAYVAQSSSGEGLIEASKYVLSPAIVLVVTSDAVRSRMSAMRGVLLGSAVAAMGLQAIVALLHIGPSGGYYTSGTYAGTYAQFGLTPSTPHEMALLGVTTAVACLLTIRDIRWRLLASAISATPALATGVRSPLVALLLSVIVIVLRARLRPSVVLTLAGAGAIVMFSGVGGIITTRYEHGLQKGEYTNFAHAGSGRGTVESTLVNTWSQSGLKAVVFGTGLRGVERISQKQLGDTVTAQSDPVAVIVELGMIGFIGWLLLWLAIVRARINWVILIPFASYALTNGALEYVGAVVFAIVLAAACSQSDGERSPSQPRDCPQPRDRPFAPPNPGLGGI